MKKRTIKKRVGKKHNRSIGKNKPLKRTNKKSKRKTSKRKTAKKVEQTGGGNITLILDILLSKDVISFLPTSQIFDFEKTARYMNMVDIHTLKDIVLENSYWRKSPTIQSIFNYSSEELKDPKKIKFDATNVNCENLINDRNNNLKKLFLFLFDCNSDIFVKENVDWYKVILGLEILDETFEYHVKKAIVEMGLYMKQEDIIENIKLLENNMDFKLIIKKRLYNCAEKPRSFFERIFSSSKPSFPSFKECDKRGNGVLHLYEEYKRFLTRKSEDGLSKLDKVKILIFCETRQHLLSKYIGLEMIRLNDKKYSEIRNILKTIYRLDKEIIKENDEKLKNIIKEEDNKKDIKENLSKIDNNADKDDAESPKPELTEEEKIIQELEEQRIKSKDESNNFLDTEKKINDKVNAQEKQVGGGLQIDEPKLEELILEPPQIQAPVETPKLVEQAPVEKPQLQGAVEAPQIQAPVEEPQIVEPVEAPAPLVTPMKDDKENSLISDTNTDTLDTLDTLDTIELEDEKPLNLEAGVTDDLKTFDDNLKTFDDNLKTDEDDQDDGSEDPVLDDTSSEEDEKQDEEISYELYTKCEGLKKKYATNPNVSVQEVNDSVINDCENAKMDVFAGIRPSSK